MESEDFIPMESMLEVSIVEDGQQIHTVDDKAEEPIESTGVLTGDDSKMSNSQSGNETLSATCDTPKTEKSQVMSGENSNATGDGKVKQANLSDVNLMATRISLEEKVFYKEMFAVTIVSDPTAIESVRLHCTACDRHLGLSAKTVIFSHRILKVLMCQRCYLFYDSGDFLQGEDGSDMFCRWCGQGGKLLCCSLCSNVFCEKCVSRNFGTTELRKIKKADDWYCFVCNLKSLWPARSTCAELKIAVAALKRKAAEVKSKEEKLPFYVDRSKCCSDGSSNIKLNTAKESATGEEQKKPLAMILPLPKKKVMLPPSITPTIPATGKQLGYITLTSEQLLRDSPSIHMPSPPFAPSAPVAPNLQRVLESMPTSPTPINKFMPAPINKYMFTKTYERVRTMLNNQLGGSAAPIGIPPGVPMPIHAAQMRDLSISGAPRLNHGRQIIQVMRKPKLGPNFFNRPQYVPLQPRQVMPDTRNVGMIPSYQAISPALQLPNHPRHFAPNQVYTVQSSFMDRVVCNDGRFPQIANQVVRPQAIPPCPPLVSASEIETKGFTNRHHPKKLSNCNEVKTKWFSCGVEKFAGVSRVLWSHMYKLRQGFVDLEAKNDLQGMKVAAGRMHNLLKVAVEHMKAIDKVIGKDFHDWSKSLKAEPKQQNVTDPEIIDITDDDDHPTPLIDDTAAEVIEVEINPDVVSLGQFSNSADDVRYFGDGTTEDPVKKNNSNNSNTGSRSERTMSNAATTNAKSAVLDHAYSVVEYETAASKPEENDVTLDLDICCESDEENHEDDAGNVTSQEKEAECDGNDIWGAEGYDSDSSLNEKLSEVMKLKQVSFVGVDDGMLLNEVTGEVAPNYECLQQSSKVHLDSVLKASLLTGKSAEAQTKNSNTFCSMCKGKSICVSNSEQFKTTDLPKNSCSIMVQTEELIENKCVSVQTESVDESEFQKPTKPWSNEFDSFLKNLNKSDDDVPSCTRRSKDVQKLKTQDDEVVLQKCSIRLQKDQFVKDSPSVAPITALNSRLRLKKEKSDFIDTDSVVSKVLRSERRTSSNESRISPASNSVGNKRHTRDFTGFGSVPKKIKCEVNVETKYPEILKKMCVVKLERLG